MQEIGESRAPQASPGKVVPLFPLPHVWLFPSVILPLSVFEPRYRQMVEDILDGPGRLVLGTIVAGHEGEAAGSPPIYPIAGLGEIGRHERLADGRFNLLLVGLQRVFVREVPSDRLYRQVDVHPAPERPIPEARERDLRTRLLAGLGARTKDLPPIPDELATAHLVDMLILRLPLPHETLNRLYGELDTEKRALEALEQHERLPDAGQ